jgi:hypothetical protein
MAAAAAAWLAAGDLLAGSSNAIQSAAGLNVSDRDGHFEVDGEHARGARNGSAGDSIHVDTPHLGGLSESTFSEKGTATGNGHLDNYIQAQKPHTNGSSSLEALVDTSKLVPSSSSSATYTPVFNDPFEADLFASMASDLNSKAPI